MEDSQCCGVLVWENRKCVNGVRARVCVRWRYCVCYSVCVCALALLCECVRWRFCVCVCVGASVCVCLRWRYLASASPKRLRVAKSATARLLWASASAEGHTA